MDKEASAVSSDSGAEELCLAMEALTRSAQPEPERPEAARLRQEFDRWKEAAGTEEAARFEARFHRAEREFNSLLLQRYEARDLERWEHYTLKCDICRELETLFAVEDAAIRQTLPRLKVLHAHWYRLHSVPREKAVELKERYDAINLAWHERLDRYFAELEGKRREASVRKQVLVETAEAVRESRDWSVTAEQLKALQQEWRSMPGAPEGTEKELYARFRAACDFFFNARNDFFREKRAATQNAVANRQDCCTALETADLEQPFDQLKRLTEDAKRYWRDCGNAGKQTDALNQRFHAALDRIFERIRSGATLALEQHRAWAERFAALLEQAENGGPNPDAASFDALTQEYHARGRLERVAGPEGLAAEQREQTLVRRFQALAQRCRRQRQIDQLEEARRQEAHNCNDLKRCRRLLQELERFAPPEDIAAWSAADLQAAIEANFGGESTMTPERLESLLRDFVALLPPPEEIDRFRAALERANRKLGI